MRMTALLCAMSVLLLACVVDPSQCDPKYDPGFLAKMGCASHYQDRQEALHNQLSHEQSKQPMFQAVYDALRQQQSDVKSALKNQQGEYQQVNSAIAQLRAQLHTRVKDQSALQKTLAVLEQQLTAVNEPSNTSKMQSS